MMLVSLAVLVYLGDFAVEMMAQPLQKKLEALIGEQLLERLLWAVLAICVVAAVLSFLKEWGAAEDEEAAPSVPGTPEKLFATESDRRNRKALLGKVRHAWIDGVLKKSLWNEARIVLQLEEQPRNVIRPYDLARRETGKPDVRLAPGRRVIEVYEEAHGALLILGQPGSGKTTLLLEVAQELLDRADGDASAQSPIPVVFNLSSWRQTEAALDSWLVTVLNQEYEVPAKIGQSWVSTGAILPLLDGLDEVPEANRAACVRAINAYRQNHGGLLPMVVCCRSAQYQQIPDLRLHTAVEILALTRVQTDQYFEAGGEKLAGIRAA